MAINVTAKPGERSASVKELQSALAYLGLYKYAIDGWYGPKTQEAVRALQQMTRAAGYDPGPIDGWFGPRSQQAFNAWDAAVNGGGGGTGASVPGAAPASAQTATPTTVPLTTTTPPGPPPLPTATPAAAIPADTGQSARAIVNNYLSQWGLSGLTDWAYGQVTTDATFDANRFVVELRQQDAYKQRFKGNEMRRAKGLPVLDESVYLATEEAIGQLFRAAGLPPGFYDSTDDFAGFIGTDVSVAELGERIAIQNRYIAQSPDAQAVKAEMQRFYGVSPTDGELAAYLLDSDKALPLLERQYRAAAASARARASGVDLGSAGLAERAGAYSEGEQAAAFEQIARDDPLYRPLYQGEQQISTEEAVSATLDRNAAAQARIETRRRKRIASTIAGQADQAEQGGRTALGSTL